MLAAVQTSVHDANRAPWKISQTRTRLCTHMPVAVSREWGRDPCSNSRPYTVCFKFLATSKMLAESSLHELCSISHPRNCIMQKQARGSGYPEPQKQGANDGHSIPRATFYGGFRV